MSRHPAGSIKPEELRTNMAAEALLIGEMDQHHSGWFGVACGVERAGIDGLSPNQTHQLGDGLLGGGIIAANKGGVPGRAVGEGRSVQHLRERGYRFD